MVRESKQLSWYRIAKRPDRSRTCAIRLTSQGFRSRANSTLCFRLLGCKRGFRIQRVGGIVGSSFLTCPLVFSLIGCLESCASAMRLIDRRGWTAKASGSKYLVVPDSGDYVVVNDQGANRFGSHLGARKSAIAQTPEVRELDQVTKG